MSRNGKVVVAMSGGVDSSVAAWMLREQGYECIGVFLRVGAQAPPDGGDCALAPAAEAGGGGGSAVAPDGAGAAVRSRAAVTLPLTPPRRLRHGCCSATDAADARNVAGRLGIPFYALNFEREFDAVIDYFADEYVRGRTPNPCVVCNTRIKFGRLLRYADALGAEFVATGHYARIVRRAGRPRLARALNPAKDQSYVLFGIPARDLERCRFPLGEFADKRLVRAAARDLGLPVHDKPDSQEICFVAGGDYRGIVRQRRPDAARAGPIRDRAGRRIAEHDGVFGFTIGQRRGLRIPAAEPLYVTGIDADGNCVTVGGREGLLSAGLTADDVNWHVPPVVAWTGCRVKIRSTHEPAPGRLRAIGDGRVAATFDAPQFAVTPGQAVVCYEDDMVLCGGWIRAATPVGPGARGEESPAIRGRC